MIHRSIVEADELYSASTTAKFEWIDVESAEFEGFVRSFQVLRAAAYVGEGGELWLEIDRELRSARSTVTVTPLPFNHAVHEWDLRLSRLKSLQIRADAQFTGATNAALKDTVQRLVKLAQSHENPLGDRSIELLGGLPVDQGAVLVPVSKYVAASSTYLKSRRGSRMRVLTPSDLLKAGVLDTLVILGTTNWYRKQQWVFTAPKARRVYLLHWVWVADSLPSSNLLIQSRTGGPAKTSEPPMQRLKDLVDSQEFMPSVDWHSVARSVGAGGDDESDNLVTARLFACRRSCGCVEY